MKKPVERFKVWHDAGVWCAQSNFGPGLIVVERATATEAVTRAHELGQEYTRHVLESLKHSASEPCDCCSKMRRKYEARLDPPDTEKGGGDT